MVELTNECQGDSLRKLALAVEPIVEGMFHREIDTSIRFEIDNAKREDIMKYSKGDLELVKLLSRTSSLRANESEMLSQGTGQL